MVRVPVKLRESINTDTLEQDVKPIGAGPHRVNTGIERDGGITNAYRDGLTTYNDVTNLTVSEGGKKLVAYSRVAGYYDIEIDDAFIGRVNVLGIAATLSLKGYSDIASTGGTLLGVRTQGAETLLDEIDQTGAVIRTKVIAPISLLNVALVKNNGPSYIATQEIVGVDPATGAFTWYKSGVGAVVFTAPGMTLAQPPYVYKYENANSYLISSPCDRLAAVGDLAAGPALVPFACWYALNQVSGGWSRHIITKQPALNAGLIEAVGYIGHTAFSAPSYSAVPLWQTPGGMAATAVNTSVYRVGYGYVEAFYTQAGAIRCLASPEINATTRTPALFSDWAVGSAMPADAFGCLTLHSGDTSANLGGFRINLINGVQSYISYAAGGTTSDMGTIISPFGEFDPTYTPQFRFSAFYAPNEMVYKYNGIFYAIFTGQMANPYHYFKHIGNNIYKINTVSVDNLLDVTNKCLLPGSPDFNGRFTQQGGSGTTNVTRTMVFSSRLGVGIDTGSKLSLSNSTQIIPIGMRQPSDTGATAAFAPFVIDEYVTDIYLRSWKSGALVGGASGGISFTDAGKTDQGYFASTSIPLPLGGNYSPQTMTWLDNTFIRPNARDEYLIGNKLDASYIVFELFGSLYGYNNGIIYLLPLSNTGYVQTPQQVAHGEGLAYITVSPLNAYFLSEWDNSIYAFDGGRALTKQVRLTQFPAITQGVWNSAENALTLNAGAKLIFVRDNIVTAIDKTADMIIFSELVSANIGAFILYQYNDPFIPGLFKAQADRWAYNGTGNLDPLEWKSAFWGMDASRQQYLSQAIYTIYSPTKEHLDLKLYAQTFDEAQTYPEQIQAVTVEPADYSSSGFVRVRLQPQIQRGLATSIGLSCPQKIVLLDVAVDTVEVEPAAITAARSV